MKLSEFVSKWTNKFCEVAGSENAKNQCVDCANAYIRDVLNLPIIEWTNAQDFPSKADKTKFEYILNTPEGVPSPGDLIIFSSPDKVGHISIFLEGNDKSFRSFEQNYPTGTPCHIQGHYYNNVLGWLHPREGGDAMKCEIKDSDGKVREMSWLLREWEVEKNDATRLAKENDSLKDKLTESADENNTLRLQLEASDKHWKESDLLLRSQIEELAGRVNVSDKEKTSLTEDNLALRNDVSNLVHEATDLQTEVAGLKLQVASVLNQTPTKVMVFVLLKRFLLKGGGELNG